MSKYQPSSVSQLNHIPFLQRKFYLFLFILLILHKNSNSFPALLDESNNTNRSFTKFWETSQPQQTSQTSQTTEFNINAQQDEQKPSYFKAIIGDNLKNYCPFRRSSKIVRLTQRGLKIPFSKLSPSFGRGSSSSFRNRTPHSEESNNSINHLGEHPSNLNYYNRLGNVPFGNDRRKHYGSYPIVCSF